MNKRREKKFCSSSIPRRLLCPEEQPQGFKALSTHLLIIYTLPTSNKDLRQLTKDSNNKEPHPLSSLAGLFYHFHDHLKKKKSIKWLFAQDGVVGAE